MWNLNTKCILVVIGATELISKYTSENINEVPVKHNNLSMQKSISEQHTWFEKLIKKGKQKSLQETP